MNKLRKLLYVFLVVGVFSLYTNVYASGIQCNWYIEGGEVAKNESVRYENVTAGVMDLYLNNYNGGGLYLRCGENASWPPAGLVFNVHLTGNNVINTNDIGINYVYSDELNFLGDGTLTINASTPIKYSTKSITRNTLYISPTDNLNAPQVNINDIKEKPAEEKKEEVKEDADSDEEKEVKEDTTTGEDNVSLLTVVYVLIGIIVVMIIMMAVMLIKLSNATSKKE